MGRLAIAEADDCASVAGEHAPDLQPEVHVARRHLILHEPVRDDQDVAMLLLAHTRTHIQRCAKCTYTCTHTHRRVPVRIHIRVRIHAKVRAYVQYIHVHTYVRACRILASLRTCVCADVAHWSSERFLHNLCEGLPEILVAVLRAGDSVLEHFSGIIFVLQVFSGTIFALHCVYDAAHMGHDVVAMLSHNDLVLVAHIAGKLREHVLDAAVLAQLSQEDRARRWWPTHLIGYALARCSWRMRPPTSPRSGPLRPGIDRPVFMFFYVSISSQAPSFYVSISSQTPRNPPRILPRRPRHWVLPARLARLFKCKHTHANSCRVDVYIYIYIYIYMYMCISICV